MKITTWAWCKASASGGAGDAIRRLHLGVAAGAAAVEGGAMVIGPQDKLLLIVSNLAPRGRGMIEMARLMDIDLRFRLRRGQ